MTTPQQIIVDASALASLVQIGAQLVQEIESIRAANPDAWAVVSQDYASATAAWEAANATTVAQVQPATAPALAVELAQVIASSAGHFNDARNSGAAPVAPAPAVDGAGLTTAPAPAPAAVTVSPSDGVQYTPPL